MKLAYVIPELHKRQGTPRCMAMLIEHAVKAGHQVTVFSRQISDLDVSVHHVYVPLCPGPGVIPFLSFWMANQAVRFFRRHCAGERFDVLHSTGPDVNTPDIVTFHCSHRAVLEWEARNAKAYPGEMGAIFRRWSHMVLAWVCAILEERLVRNPSLKVAILLSERTRKEFELLPKARKQTMHVIPNGVDIQAFHPRAKASRGAFRSARSISEHDFLVLFVGNAWERKGLRTLMEACGRLREKPITLQIVGQGNVPYYQTLAKTAGLGHVLFDGKDAVLDMTPYYGAADVLVLSSMREEFGMPPLEAMACGVPVILGRDIGISEWVEPRVEGFIHEHLTDAEELAGHLNWLIDHPAERERMGMAARKKAEQFSWERIARETFQLYEQIVCLP